MKTYSSGSKKRFATFSGFRKERGFALVISLSLMVLLTVLAVGLLSLSTISVRASSHGDAMYTARANARLALSLAIGQLQKNAGPDQRITAPSNLANAQSTPGIAGAWESWKQSPQGAGDYQGEKDSRFLGYLMSNRDFSGSQNADSLPTGENPELLLGGGTLGKSGDIRENEVRAPRLTIGEGSSSAGSLAWATLDEGVKGRIDLLPNPEKSGESLGTSITRVGSSARNQAGTFAGMEWLDGNDEKLAVDLPKLVSPAEVSLMAGDKETFGKYFHDFSVTSTSLQADVANGGLKTDLSMVFDRASLDAAFAARRVYSNNDTALGGTAAADPMFGMLHHYYRLYQRATANDNPVDGLKNYVPTRYQLSSVTDRALRASRYEANLARLNESIIMPTVVKVDIVFSLVVRDAHGPWADQAKPKGYPYMLHLMYLPVITLHNPYNTRLRFRDLEMEFRDLPIGFQFFVNNQPANDKMVGLNQLYIDYEGGGDKVFKMILTGDIDRPTDVIMEPGETRIFGKPFPPTLTWAQDVGVNGGYSFDFANNKTGHGVKIMPGMITDAKSGVGYDVDWLSPGAGRQPWVSSRTSGGVIPVKGNELVSVRYGPMVPAGGRAGNKFSVIMRATPSGSATLPPERSYAVTQVFYKDENTLRSLVSEGTSPRFPTARNFPEQFPNPTVEGNRRADQLYERNATAIRDYENAAPFAILSLSGKTTMDSFTRSRPMVDTGIATQMATCDFTSVRSQGASPYELVMTPVRGGSGGIESDGLKGYFFGGHGSFRGTTSAAIYEIPKAPLQSIAQLRHVNFANLGAAPNVTYAIGEARAHPAIPSGVAQHTDNGRILSDPSWLANNTLWDAYWFSSLATLQGKAFSGSDSISQSGLAQEFFNGSRNLPNPRNVAYFSAGNSPEDTANTVVADVLGTKSAAHILTRGGFNVNSVSRNAWISVLSSLANVSVPLASGTLEAPEGGTPMLRMRQPIGGQREVRELKSQLWNSYRTLSPQEIEGLADQIIAEIRQRGPFLSMSEFVNRRLETGDLGRKGALQAAIDRTEINAGMSANAMPIDASLAGGYGWANPDALTGSTTAASAPGEISQGDILSAIGSFITVRSDTFRIRAYGDSRDKQGNVLARAWCEATVQRLPEYVDSTDIASAVPSSTANINFGRRFSVIAFRWLHAEEV